MILNDIAPYTSHDPRPREMIYEKKMGKRKEMVAGGLVSLPLTILEHFTLNRMKQSNEKWLC